MIEPNLDRVWAALVTAARPSHTPLTVLQLATSGLDGAPKVRSVILRGADAERGAVSFFTDVRSAKIEEMRHQPRVSLVGYERGRRISNPSRGQGDHRRRGSGKSSGLGGLSISYPRTLPASAAFRDPDQRTSRSCARRRLRWRKAFRHDRRLDRPYRLARYLSTSAPACGVSARRLRLAWRLGFPVGDAPCCREPRVGSTIVVCELSAAGAILAWRFRRLPGRDRPFAIDDHWALRSGASTVLVTRAAKQSCRQGGVPVVRRCWATIVGARIGTLRRWGVRANI